ncbi:FHA domain-containing protein [Agromyces allii]|uniref:FHA domain-containing protein n=1 Tax=Agromyces allii TaxID=393607 RepID=UPI0031DED55E
MAPAAATPFGAIRLTLPNHDSVELQAGERVILGRESPNESVARAFPAKLEDVSRQHVRVVNDASGPALVMLGETGGSVGGTFVGDRKLPNDEGERFPLHHGDRIRLGSLAWCKVEFIDA